jgi:endoglucanase
MLKEKLLKIAKDFLAIPTAPFREHQIRAYIKDFCEKRNCTTNTDKYGNLSVFYKDNSAPQLSFVVHMDHPGFIASEQTIENTCSAYFYGVWSPEEFSAAPILFFPDHLPPVHATATKWEKDFKARAWKATLTTSGIINKGDIGMWDFPPFKIGTKFLHSRNCDDSIGCILLLMLIDHCNQNNICTPFSVLFTCAEEAGLYGTKFICQQKSINYENVIISIETSKELPIAKIHDGVIIRVGDAHSIFTPSVTDTIITVAKSLKANNPEFSFQRKLMDGGVCEASIFSQFDYKTGALSIPLGNYHNRNFEKRTTEAEYVSIKDCIDGFRLISAIIENQSLFFIAEKASKPRYKVIKGELGQVFLDK